MSRITIRTIVFAALFCLLPQQSSWAAENPKMHAQKNQQSVPKPVAGQIIDFPNQPVAVLNISVPNPEGGKPKKLSLLAKGHVVIPAGSEIDIDLRFAGPENMAALEQLDPHLVTHFSAAKLEFGDEQMKHVAHFKYLKLINLSETLVTEKSLPVIGSLSKLHRIIINTTDITGDGFASLAGLRHLDRMSMEGIRLKPGSLAKLLPLAPNLRTFDVARCGLTAQDLATIGQFHNLNRLDICGNHLIGDSAVKHLKGLDQLNYLDITDTGITEHSLDELCALPKLEKLVVRGRKFWKDGKEHSRNSRVKIKDSSSKIKVPLEMFSPLH